VRRRLALAGAVVLCAVVVPTAVSAGSATDSYVALGDSFTAGPLIAAQLQDPPGCLRSDHNYPHLVAAALGIARFEDASCSGAGTDDMTEPQDVDPGRDNRPQLRRLRDSTSLVTIGIGGNDIGFSEIVEECATADRSGTPCQDHYLDGDDDEITDRIADTRPKVAKVLRDIRRRSPDARILVVNYLSILPETGTGCWPQVPFAERDVPYLRAKQRELNGMLARQARRSRATVVDAFTSSIGHDACQPPGARWVEPLLGASGAAPLHPNQLGMECTAAAVLAEIAPDMPPDPALCSSLATP
jgi:lysophospholipase L1-like esterase